MNAKAQVRAKYEERVTFVMQAQDRANVLLSVVALFDELKIEIEALWMIRAKRTRNERISVTVHAKPDGWRRAVGICRCQAWWSSRSKMESAKVNRRCATNNMTVKDAHGDVGR